MNLSKKLMKKKEINVIGVIPARYASSRIPHKLLQNLCGKSILQRTWEKASGARLLDKLIIAYDHPEIGAETKKIGAEAIATSIHHKSGTDRIAEAVREIEASVVINIQADEPLIHPSVIDSLAQEMLTNRNLKMATVKKIITDPWQANDSNVVKVITDKSGFAVYFSRWPIPYYRNSQKNKTYYKHLGIYAYSKDFLYAFKNLPRSELEQAEKLEQLRVLESGYKIKVIDTHFDSWGIDSPEDLKKAKEVLRKNCK